MTPVVKICTEHTTTVCQHVGSNDMERPRRTHSGWMGWPTLAVRKNSLFFPTGMHLGCGETFSREQLEENIFSSTPVQTSISAIRSNVTIPLLKKGDIVGTHHMPPCWFTCVTMKRKWANGMENLPWT